MTTYLPTDPAPQPPVEVPPAPPHVTVVVPTRHEADNIEILVNRLSAALGTTPAEILFVDDSDDDTPRRILDVAADAPIPVRLVHRLNGERAGGLGSAVLTGIRLSAANWVVVMDGDLQHPPEIVPQLVGTGDTESADVVVASRYAGLGSASGLSSMARGWVSRSSTHLTRAAFPRRLSRCTDPMSGFFAVRRSSIDPDALKPQGFKILLEILARSRRLQVREVDFTFGARASGDSKASWQEGVLFLRRLASLRCASAFGRHSARVASMIAFGLAGLSGIGVNTLALYLLVNVLSGPLLLSACLATQVSTVWNFALIDKVVYRGPKARGPLRRFLGFALLNNLALLARLPLLGLLVHSFGVHYLLANILSLLAAFLIRYAISDRLLFAPGDPMTTTAPKPVAPKPLAVPRRRFGAGGRRASSPASTRRFGPVDLVVDLTEGGGSAVRRRPTPATHSYSVHGIVTIRSSIRLPELEHFASPVEGKADIEIGPGDFPPGARRRTCVTQFASRPAVSYQEHLGPRGSDFYIDMTDGIEISVGRMLERSPHVLYTNVVEALLRFVLVSRGYMLLHSACLDFDGHGVLLSALTDTGKTGTVLRLLREHGGRFLSDDMTILNADGHALCYPKPLTISQHTLRAVNAGDLTAREWRLLRVQSRVHSKEGRGIGARLGEINVPIMSLNAVTQRIVPPPKYLVNRLVPCELGNEVDIENLFIIERAPNRISEIDAEGLIDELIANTDDAYGFPPFRYLAPAFVVGGEQYEELRARERAILVSAMSRVRARRIATPDFTWADHIPGLVRQDGPAGAPPLGAAADISPTSG